MKNYLAEWKKYLKKESVDSAQKDLQASSEAEKATQNYADSIKKQAQQEKESAQKQLDLEKAKEEAEKSSAAKKTGITTTSSTTGTVKEADNMSVGGQADGTVGNTPGNFPDKPELKVTIGTSLANLKLDEKDCGMYEGVCDEGELHEIEMCYEEIEEEKTCGKCTSCMKESSLNEAKYQGRSVPLNKPMRGDVKKFKVYVKDPQTGNIKKVNFGDKKMRIKKSNPKRRKSFRARHHCENPGPKTKARYWSCRKW